MTREEAKRFWLFIYENAKDFSDPHWEAQERREHREYVEALRMAIEALSADAVQGWVPCSERLPEEHEWIGTKMFGTTISDEVCITFDKNGERFVRVMSLQNGKLSDSDKKTMDVFHKGWKMLAWMPLPEPDKKSNGKPCTVASANVESYGESY